MPEYSIKKQDNASISDGFKKQIGVKFGGEFEAAIYNANNGNLYGLIFKITKTTKDYYKVYLDINEFADDEVGDIVSKCVRDFGKNIYLILDEALLLEELPHNKTI